MQQPTAANGEINNNIGGGGSNNNISGAGYQHLQNGNGGNYGKNSSHYQQLQHNGSGSGTGVIQNGATSNYSQHPNSQNHHYQQLPQHQQQQQQSHHYGSSAEDHYELTQAQYGHNGSNASATGGGNSARPNGPNLVNKQLVLPFVPPSFPNNSLDGITHLIKPSEYLKSISDKRSCPSSAR